MILPCDGKSSGNSVTVNRIDLNDLIHAEVSRQSQ